jgi:arylformamidase
MARILAGGATMDIAAAGATPDHHQAPHQTHRNPPNAPDRATVLARWREATAAARAQLRPGTARYGAGQHQALDIYAPDGARGAPVVVFINGGGWDALSRDAAGFAAPAFVAAGTVFVTFDATPLPGASLAELLNQARRAIRWLHTHIEAHGGSVQRLTLCGHGAGAYIAAMLAGTNWRADGLPADLIKGAALISGTYDLEPLQRDGADVLLQLDRISALRLSPIRSLPPPTCRVLVAHAAHDPGTLARQSDSYALALRASGGRVETLVVPGHDHFSAIETLADPESVLGAAALELCRV